MPLLKIPLMAASQQSRPAQPWNELPQAAAYPGQQIKS